MSAFLDQFPLQYREIILSIPSRYGHYEPNTIDVFCDILSWDKDITNDQYVTFLNFLCFAEQCSLGDTITDSRATMINNIADFFTQKLYPDDLP